MKRLLVALVTAGLLLQPSALTAEEPLYQKGRSFFPNFLSQYQPMEVPGPELSNSERVQQMIREGKMTLSLSDAIALALENNLDISIQRFTPKLADLDILRSKAGAGTRGIRTAVTSGSVVTPTGGGTGGVGGVTTFGGGTTTTTGGTTTTTGGATTTTGGTTTTTGGAAVGNFDPVVTSTLSINHSAFPITDVVTQQFLRVNSTQINTGTANFAYQQAFHSGTALSFGWGNSRRTNLLNSISPQISSNFQAQLSQRLLQGFGFAPNTRNIRIAKNNREVSDLVFKQQVIQTVTQLQNLYWDLVSAIEDVKVRERSVAVAEKLYNDNKRQVEIGTLAPIEIVRAEAEVARTRQELIVAQTLLQQLETSMKNLVVRNLSDPAVATARVVPVERITVPPVEPVVPVQELIGTALSARPELAQSRIDLNNRDINIKSAKNSLLPSLDAFAYWGGRGTAGLATPFIRPGQTEPTRIPASLTGGLGSALGQAFGGDFKDYAFGLQMAIPVHNRAAQADAAQAEIEDRQARLRLRQQENAVRVEVQNALIALQQNRARVEAAQKQRELQERTLDAEQKKFQLGASTIFLVIQAQRDLAQAQSAEVRALGDYMKSRVDIDRSTGQTILKNGIVLEEAYKGQVTKPPQALPTARQEL